MDIVILGGIGFYLPQIALWLIVIDAEEADLPDAAGRAGPVGGVRGIGARAGRGVAEGDRRDEGPRQDHLRGIRAGEPAASDGPAAPGSVARPGGADGGGRYAALAAILIQADRFGSSIAQALRVQSDSMRVRRRQLAEEKAAKTAVQLIFPLVLFIFPAIFVVLVGPAAIQIQHGLLKK